LKKVMSIVFICDFNVQIAVKTVHSFLQ